MVMFDDESMMMSSRKFKLGGGRRKREVTTITPTLIGYQVRKASRKLGNQSPRDTIRRGRRLQLAIFWRRLVSGSLTEIMATFRLAATLVATPPILRRAVINQAVIRARTAACFSTTPSLGYPRARFSVRPERARSEGLKEEEELWEEEGEEVEEEDIPPRDKIQPPQPPPQEIPRPPKPKHQNAGSFPIPTSYLPPPSNDPNQRAVPAVPLCANALYHATHIFSSSRPKFLYSAGRFLELPRNPHTPEVCLIGRSNVGKSTLINALAGLAGSTARNTHGLRARQANSAITSRKAGCTVTLNGYGFGEPPVQPKEAQQQQQQQQSQPRKREEEKEKQSGLTRSERRQAQKESGRKDAPRTHALVMVDMPGYGHASEQAWGKEIQKYLEKRVMLRGAIVLIDSVSGVKPLDRQVLHNLRNAGLRTAVVLTKVDKLIEGKNSEKAKQKIEQVCLSVWKELRGVERRGGEWTEGAEHGWEREVFVTGAGDPKNAGLGVESARWAICRMAGLVEDTREVVVPGLEAAPNEIKIVGFDEIKWAPAKPVEVKEKAEEEVKRVTTFEALIKATEAKPRKKGEKRLRASF
ncbi:hypothetical protein QBC44DRAFT_314090 [Cladorrhinum sp. PSN332]|nr:hypothetical protein QBC44DRAFT_314090 [Cladorrhinum sp. PSN332]